MKKRLVLIDYLKAICVLLVILTHGSNINTAMLDKTGLFYLLIVNKCVPVFMFLSGYVYTLGRSKSINEQYSPNILVPKILRLTVPTVIAYGVYIALNMVNNRDINIVKNFLLGDFGPGSYYYSVMLQFILLAPIMFLVIKKLNTWGVGILGAVNLAYELLAVGLNVDIAYYRIIFFRYLLVAAFGMYFGINKDKKLNYVSLFVMGICGLTYILAPYLWGYQYQIFTISPWNRSNMMSSFYVAALIAVVIRKFADTEESGIFSKIFSYIGQASYHIMYTQMIYFVFRPAIDKVYDITLLPLFVQYMVDIVVPVSLGILFCMADNKIFGKIYKTK